MSPRVVVLSTSSRFDTRDAERYGTAVPLLERTVSPFAVDDIRDSVVAAMHEMRFDPEVDYFVLTGPTAVLAIAFGAAIATYRKLRVLLFDAAASAYVLRIMEVD